MISASGDLTKGIKARLWSASHDGQAAPVAFSDYLIPASWTEAPNAACYTRSSDVASTCGAGLDRFANSAKFVLGGGHTSLLDFLATGGDQTFTAVDLDSDVQ